MIATTQMYGDYKTPLVNNKVDLLIEIATEKEENINSKSLPLDVYQIKCFNS
jgi:hypothetical protein